MIAKKICLLSLIAASYVGISQTQTSKGHHLFGIDGMYSNFNYEKRIAVANSSNASKQNYNNQASKANLQYGYFIANNFAIGLFGYYNNYLSTGDYLNQQSQYSSNYLQKTSIFGAGLFARYYKPLGEGKLLIFGEFNGNIGFGNYDNNNNTYSNWGLPKYSMTKGKTKEIGVSVRPGICYFISPRLGLEAMLGSISFENTKRTDKESTENALQIEKLNYFNFDYSISSISFGLKFYVGGK